MTKAKQKRQTRVWTDAERATGVALVARNGGNVKRTVRELRFPDGAKVSESTLRGWISNPPPAPLVDTATLTFDQFSSVAKGTVMKLAVGMNRDEWVARVLAQKGPVAAIVMGTVYDKVRLEEGRATEIVDTPFGQLLTELRDMRKPLAVIDGGKKESGA